MLLNSEDCNLHKHEYNKAFFRTDIRPIHKQCHTISRSPTPKRFNANKIQHFHDHAILLYSYAKDHTHASPRLNSFTPTLIHSMYIHALTPTIIHTHTNIRPHSSMPFSSTLRLPHAQTHPRPHSSTPTQHSCFE